MKENRKLQKKKRKKKGEWLKMKRKAKNGTWYERGEKLQTANSPYTYYIIRISPRDMSVYIV